MTTPQNTWDLPSRLRSLTRSSHHRLTPNLDHRRLRTSRIGMAWQYYARRWPYRSHEFRITPQTLIPRPETELLLDFIPHPVETVVDVGTGSGIIGLTCLLEHHAQRAILTDLSLRALRVARHNAAQLNLVSDSTLLYGSLLRPILQSSIEGSWGMIANLPYIPESMPPYGPSMTLRSEPHTALYAPDSGLGLIRELLLQLSQMTQRHRPPSYLLLEHLPSQSADLQPLCTDLFPMAHFQPHHDYHGDPRFTLLSWPDQHSS